MGGEAGRGRLLHGPGGLRSEGLGCSPSGPGPAPYALVTSSSPAVTATWIPAGRCTWARGMTAGQIVEDVAEGNRLPLREAGEGCREVGTLGPLGEEEQQPPSNCQSCLPPAPSRSSTMGLGPLPIRPGRRFPAKAVDESSAATRPRTAGLQDSRRTALPQGGTCPTRGGLATPRNMPLPRPQTWGATAASLTLDSLQATQRPNSRL